MRGETIPLLDDQGRVIGRACGVRRRKRKCIVCKRRDGVRLCDGQLGDGKTCDAPLCLDCTNRPGGVEVDYCPEHSARGAPAMHMSAGDIPALGLDTTLRSGFRIVTLELEGGAWRTSVLGPRKQREQRSAVSELEARANHAALCAEYGP